MMSPKPLSAFERKWSTAAVAVVVGKQVYPLLTNQLLTALLVVVVIAVVVVVVAVAVVLAIDMLICSL